MTCLKCGRTVPERVLLCTECRHKPSAPVRSKIEPSREQQLQSLVRRLNKSRRRLRVCLVIFVLLCAGSLAVIAGAWNYFTEQNNRIAAQTSRLNSLETALTQAKDELAQVNTLNDTLRESSAENQRLLDELEKLTGLTAQQMLDERP